MNVFPFSKFFCVVKKVIANLEIIIPKFEIVISKLEIIIPKFAIENLWRLFNVFCLSLSGKYSGISIILSSDPCCFQPIYSTFAS